MIIPYKRELAREYAIKWALARNPNFYDFENHGGDCTNYISQCLLAGRGKMNYNKITGWFYENANNRAPSWTSVNHLEKFLLRTDGIGPFGKVVELNKLEIGDIVQIRQNPTRFNHSVIVTDIINGELYVCAHTNDALSKRLESYYYRELMGIHIEGVRI